MAKKSQPHGGSLQFWPRKRARKFLPSVNWKAISEKNKENKVLGFIGYKVGMGSCLVKDLTQDSLTKDKKIYVPVSVLEVPSMKIFSVRFYKNNIVKDEVINENLDKELKKKLKSGKKKNRGLDEVKDYEDIRMVVYSKVKDTGIKKTPDLCEIGLSGSLDEKLKFAKENINKELHFSDLFNSGLVDVRGLTKGKGIEGTIKRFGIGLKSHKSEKGRRRPGSLGPWHPAHVVFRVAMAGQLGMFTREIYNLKIISVGKVSEKDINPKQGWKHYGRIKTDYLLVKGSVPGTEKRQLLITLPLRATKKRAKQNFEFLGLR